MIQETLERIGNFKMRNNRHYPIVLAHGIARPDYLIDSVFRTLNLSLYDLSFVSDKFHYFKGIASYLKKHGFEVYHTRVSFAADVGTRARDLRKEILKILERSDHKKVHIIAHSMGGLDARYMIVREGMAGAVATLTTIGTPHLGTSIADLVLTQGVEFFLARFRWILNLEGIKSVTTTACKEFNEEARNAEATNGVVYQTYASWKECGRVFLPFQLSCKLILEREGKNDGLVSERSQRWVEKLESDSGEIKYIRQFDFPIQADHFDQVGWWNLNELHKAGWWNIRALKEKNKHEQIIKDLYLKIAREVVNLEGYDSFPEVDLDLEQKYKETQKTVHKK